MFRVQGSSASPSSDLGSEHLDALFQEGGGGERHRPPIFGREKEHHPLGENRTLFQTRGRVRHVRLHASRGPALDLAAPHLLSSAGEVGCERRAPEKLRCRGERPVVGLGVQGSGFRV